MARTRFEWSIWILLAALLGTGWIVVSRSPVTESRGITLTEAPIVGHLAPTFTLPTTTGESVALASYFGETAETGQPVVLNFWATWCGPCRIEMPHFQDASLRYKGKVVILGVNQGESVETITAYAESIGITYPLLVDADNQVSLTYNVNNLPTTIFIDRQGIVREVVIGTMSKGVLEDRIERLLRE